MKTMNKLLHTSGIKLKFVLENVNDKSKLQRTKTVVSFPDDGEMAASQMRVKMSNNNNSQRNHSSDNAETARCFISSSHHGLKATFHVSDEYKGNNS